MAALSLYHAFMVILTPAWWGGPIVIPVFRWENRGMSREPRCLACRAELPPCPGLDVVSRPGSSESLQPFSADPCRNAALLSCEGRGLAVRSFPKHGRSQSGAEVVEPHTERSKEQNHLLPSTGPFNPAVLLPDAPQFWERMNPLLPNVVSTGVLPPKKV